MDRKEGWGVWNRRLLAVLGLTFAACVGLRLHGYSLAMWHDTIDGSPAPEIIMGAPQAIRSDDWALDLTLILSELRARPPFAVVNGNIGLGQNMLVPFKMPSRSLLTFFRPTVWGFFIGPDFGMAWMWWAMSLGLFYSVFLVLSILSKRDFWVSSLGALSIVLAPYFQFWSFHVIEPVIHGALILVSAVLLVRATRRSHALGAGLLLGWSTGCFFFDYIYPPTILIVGYLILVLLVGYLIEQRRDERFRKLLGSKFAGLCIAFAVVVFSAAILWRDAGSAIAAIQNTTYPGRRVSTGGFGNPWTYFADNFFIARQHSGPSSNPCESSGFMMLFPGILAFFLIRFIAGLAQPSRDRKTFDWLVAGMFAYTAFIFAYVIWGFPPWMASLTQFSRVVSNRVVIGLGLVNVILIVRYLGAAEDGTAEARFRLLSARTGAAIVSAGVACTAAIALKQSYESATPALIAAGLVAQLVLVLILFYVKNPRCFFLPAFCLVSAIYTLGYNPLARGGTDFLYDNPISRKIQEISASGPPSARWIAIGQRPTDVWALSNLFRVLGVPSVGGYNCPTQNEVWKMLDRGGSFSDVTNQCGFFTFAMGESGEFRAKSPSNGNVDVMIDPNDTGLRDLNVQYFLVAGFSARPRPFGADFKRVFQLKDKEIYVRSPAIGSEVF